LQKLVLLLIMISFLCACAKAPPLEAHTSMPSMPPVEVTESPSIQAGKPTPSPSGAGLSLSLEERMTALSFTPVSGQYVRKSVQGDVAYTEMFVTDRSSFVRAALDETEEEVFVYDYQLDRFTYMYFFEGEMLSKVVYDMAAGTVLEDDDDLSDLLIGSALDLRDYFFELLDTAGIGVDELL